MSNSNFIGDCLHIYDNYFIPILFDENNLFKIWPLFVIILLIFLITIEIRSQSCEDGNCDHYKNMDLFTSSDLCTKKIDTIIYRLNLNYTVVSWRDL